MSIKGLMGKQNVIYMYNEISYLKEILTHAKTWMNLEDTMLSEINQTQDTNTVLFYYMRYLE